MKNKIKKLLLDGLSYSEISIALGCSKSTISYHAKKLGISKKRIAHFNWNEIQKFYNEGNSYRKCKEKFGFSSQAWDNAVKAKKLTTNNKSKEIFELRKRFSVKKQIRKNNLIEYVCKICGLIPEWNNKPLVLQLDHINGINNDNRLENLRFLCPNCHSQTDTFCHKNRKNIRK